MPEREYIVRVSESRQPVAAAAVATVMQTATGERQENKAWPGFVRVRWDGEEYDFIGTLQRAAVAVLWSAWKSGEPDVEERMLLREIDSDSAELRLLFRNHKAFGTMIQRSHLHAGPIGHYRLAAGTA